MEFLLGMFVGSTAMLVFLCILAVATSNKRKKGDNQECTNQKQQ